MGLETAQGSVNYKQFNNTDGVTFGWSDASFRDK